jgi:hypothetical protein
VNELPRRQTCPLGHECERIVDGAIETCAWYISIVGVHPQTGEEKDEKGCAMAWQPVIMLETNKELRDTAASVQSLRNELTKRIDRAMMGVNVEKSIEHN